MIFVDDHEPMHVHAIKAGEEVVINLGAEGELPSVRAVKNMKRANVRRALDIATDN